MALFHPSSATLSFCASLFALLLMRGEGFSNGAPPESCDDMLPVHKHVGMPVSNTTCSPPCPTLEVVGYEGRNSFNYTCGAPYTLTAKVTSIMVEAREASDSFNSSMPHVGAFSVDGSTDLQIICEGNAVTQSRILSGQAFNFTWIAPGPGNPKSVRFWFTVVPAPAAFYAQLVGPVGEPDPSSCTCDANQYIYQPPGTPDTMSVCLPCPANSSSATGNVEVCECLAGTGRVSEASGLLDPTEPCTTCPGAPTAPSLTIDTPPDVTVTWSLPSASSAWPLKYRVEWSNGTVLGDNLNTLSVVVSGVGHVTQYSIVITALTNSSCTDEKVMFNFTTGQRCPSNSPLFIGSPDTSTNNVTLVWDEPYIMDPLVFDPRYAVYTMCDGDAAPTLQAADLQSSSYIITGLPASERCTAWVVLYSRHCDANPTGPLVDTVTFTTAATLPKGLISSPSGGGQQTLFIEAGDSPGTLSIRIIPEQGIPRYVVVYVDISTPSTTVEVTRQSQAGVANWIINVSEGRTYSVQCAGINADGVRGPFGSPATVFVPRVSTEPPQPTVSFSIFVACVVALGGLLCVAVFVLLACSVYMCTKQSGSKQYAVPSTVASSQPGTPHLNKETKMDAIADSTPTSPEESELLDKPSTTTFNVFQPALEESSRSSS